MSAHQYDHGHTVAGWVGFGIATVGAGVAGLGVCTASGLLIAGGAAIGVVSLLVTWALHLAGWGKGPGLRPRAEWGWRGRDSAAPGGHAECLGCRLAGRRGRGAPAAVPVMPAQRESEPETVAAAGADSVR
ncbi:HGxxPAAW family protein [Streptomyces sp. NRRL S-146]|uniref:HGxxPAAW family protein n=1 Tax=Streptomyces sp. NRRL S-146 TaxID=1463884 RepID=UPI0004CA83AA|nr:HGxxPAAW family protein [Streptomyces sp. NRRL S-146]